MVVMKFLKPFSMISTTALVIANDFLLMPMFPKIVSPIRGVVGRKLS